MDLLPTLLGALPELGAMGVALVVLTVFRRQQREDTAELRASAKEDREYFSAERARIKAEAAEEIRLTREAAMAVQDRLVKEMRDLKEELRQADREVDRLRASLYPQTPATTRLPAPSRHRHDDVF